VCTVLNLHDGVETGSSFIDPPGIMRRIGVGKHDEYPLTGIMLLCAAGGRAASTGLADATPAIASPPMAAVAARTIPA